MSEHTDRLATTALRSVAIFSAETARDEHRHVQLRVKFAAYKQQHQRLLMAHKALKHDYAALKFHYDAIVRELAREEAEEAASA